MSLSPRESVGGERKSLSRGVQQHTGEPSPRAMEVIRSLDSRSFGFLDFQTSSSNTTTENSSSSTSFVSREFIQQGIAKLCRDLRAGPQSDTFKSELYCQLGHLHLLLEEYSEALSAYKQYKTFSPIDSSKNANMHYGIGVIYFSINSYRWAIQSFNEVLALSPDFARRGEIHLRLGVMFKTKGHYTTSINHFKQAMSLTGPSSFSKLEIQFHLGHIHYLQGHYVEAKEAFEGILAKKNVPSLIKAMALRQLGWLYHTSPEVAMSTENSMSKAVELLKLAVGADPSSSQAWYFLGRCHAAQGRAREAFLSYQQAVNKSSDNQADVWCSIGILYHNMGQPKDSLQSYICAVYLDPNQHEAWTDMGCLFEAVSQPIDALIAYKNAISIMQREQTDDKTGQYAYSRVANLEQYITMVGPSLLQAQPTTLPTLKEAWRTLVPTHIKNSQSLEGHTPILDLNSVQASSHLPSSLPLHPGVTNVHSSHSNITPSGPVAKRQRTNRHNKDPIIIRNMSDGWMTPNPSAPTPSNLPTPLHSLAPSSNPSMLPNGSLFPGPGPAQGFEHIEQAGDPVNIGDHSLKEHDILAQPNHYSTHHVYNEDGADNYSMPHMRGVLSPNEGQFQASGTIPSLLSGRQAPRPTSLGSKRRHDNLSQNHLLGNEGSSLAQNVSHSTYSNPSSVSGSSLTCTPLPLDDLHGSNSTPTSFNFVPAHMMPTTINPFVSQAVPSATGITDLPGDLSSISPLDLDRDMRIDDESMKEYLKESSSQESLTNRAVTDLLKSPTPGSIPRRTSSSKVASYLKELSHTDKPLSMESNLLRVESPLFLAGAIHREQHHSSSSGVLDNSPGNLQISFEDCDHGSPTSLINPLSVGPKSSKVCEINSDSSSGVSSADTKFSTFSASPLISPASPLISPSSPVLRHLILPSFLETSDDSSDEFDELLDPIHEPYPSLADDGEYMMHDPDLTPPDPPGEQDEMELRPEVPIFEVSTRDEAMSEELHGLCCNPDTPVCMIRGICPLVDLDLELFSSKNIVRACPEHEMEVREQVQQCADENFDPNGRKQVWKCESSRTFTTVKEYAKYQKQILSKQDPSISFEDDKKWRAGSSKKMIRFGTNVDLSDWDKWGGQLEELDKLPKFLRVSCPEANLLTHIGHSILGVNSAQLYMKVPGARTPGHQENHNLCSVNINIGPGGCEWFAVHNKYWGVFHKLCEKHKLCFLTGSWWPILDELYKLKVPVFRFTQYTGDVVWLNPGTVHWVQANAVCNNIAWNVGPITGHQFRMAWERYMWNKVHSVRSIVPMIHLSWNLAKRLKIIDNALYLQLRSLLVSSLAQTHRLTNHLEKASIPMVPHVREDNEPAPCCNHCLDEVFNILFVLSHKGEYLVYCHKCAMAMKKSFTVLKQFDTDELESILDNFKLHKSAYRVVST